MKALQAVLKLKESLLQLFYYYYYQEKMLHVTIGVLI